MPTLNLITVAEAAGVSSILNDVGTVVTSAAGWITTYANKIVETPLLMTFVAVPLVGLGVGLIRRLMSVN